MNKKQIILFLIVFYGCQHKTAEINYLSDVNADYSGENIEFTLPCGDIIAGTLTYPKKSPGKLPAMILITGSSAHDRDNSKPDLPADTYRPFRQIAAKLSSNGIAVLRLDDRGISKSKGGNINNMTTPERANDIKAGIHFLKNRKEIDSTRIGLLGLSEGASIAHIIASKDNSVKTLVLLSAIGSTGKQIIEFQMKNSLINRGELQELLKRDINLQYLYGFNPLETAGLIHCPVLIINGKADKRVPYKDAYKLSEAIKLNGNIHVEVKVLPEYNHLLLKVSQNGVETRYGKINSNKVPDEVLDLISEWLILKL